MRDQESTIASFEHDSAAVSREPSPDGQAGMTLVELLILLARGKRLITTVTAIAVTAGVVTSLIWPVLFTAKVVIMPPHQTQSAAAMMMSSLTSGMGASSLAAAAAGVGIRSPNEIYMDLLRSRPVADALIGQFGLAKEYHARDATAARKELAGRTTIVSMKSDLLAISVADPSKTRAAEIANAYAEQLRALTRTLAISEASQRRLFYEEQLKHARDDLAAAELAYEQVQQKKGVIQPDAQARAMIGNLAGLQAEISAKRVQLQALRSYSTDQNPDVEIAERELTSLEDQVTRIGQQNAGSDASNVGLQYAPGSSMEYLRAVHEMLYRQTLYDLLIKQYDAARLDEAKEGAEIQVVEPAIPPDRRSSPSSRAQIVLGFLLAGLVGSSIFLYAAEKLRQQPSILRSLAQLRSALWGR